MTIRYNENIGTTNVIEHTHTLGGANHTARIVMITTPVRHPHGLLRHKSCSKNDFTPNEHPPLHPRPQTPWVRRFRSAAINAGVGALNRRVRLTGASATSGFQDYLRLDVRPTRTLYRNGIRGRRRNNNNITVL